MENSFVLSDLLEGITEPIESIENSRSALPSNLPSLFRRFYGQSNGGLTKGGYFHFFGTGGPAWHDVVAWNAPDIWKSSYEIDLSNLFFFSEDVFGNQFGFDLSSESENVFLFWVDDGRLEHFAESVEEFLNYTVYGVETFREMKQLYERFPESRGGSKLPLQHLSYKIPILLGGQSDSPLNLEYSDPIQHLRLLGQIVTQCKKLGHGTKVVDVEWDVENQTVRLISQ